MAGIYELYYMDDKKRLNLFYFAWVWYGGLRHTLRQITDPDLNLTHPKRRQVLEERECFYRYTLIESQGDMEDVLHFLAFQKVASPEVPAHSGRYEDILLDEISPDKVFDSN